MSKFKVGDRVKRVKNNLTSMPVGFIGIITKVRDISIWFDLNAGGYSEDNYELAEDGMKIREAIEALPICEEGKAGVKKLVEALGHKVEEVRELKAGNVVSLNGSSEYIRVLFKMDQRLAAIDIGNWVCVTTDIKHGVGKYVFEATNLEEYYNRKSYGTF